MATLTGTAYVQSILDATGIKLTVVEKKIIEIGRASCRERV